MPDPYDTLPKVEILDEEGNVYATWTSKDIPDGKTFEALIARILNYHPEVLGYVEFPTEYSKDLMVDFEVTLDDQGVPNDPDRIGNFVINTFTNGPVELTDATPIRMHVQVMQDDEHGYYVRHTVFTNDRCFYKTSFANDWVDAMAGSGEKPRIYRGDADPTKNADGEQLEIENLDSLAWLDISNAEYPVLKTAHKADDETIVWSEVWAPGAMSEDVYDTEHRHTNMYAYLNDILEQLTGDYGLFLKHKANELVLIHVTIAERLQWDAALTLDELLAVLNQFLQDMQQDIEDLYDSETEFSKIGGEYDDTRAKYFAHIDPEGDPPHMTEEDARNWDRKAASDHCHFIDGRVAIRAEDVVTGKLKAETLPDSIKERVIELESIEKLGDPVITDEDRKGKYHTGNVIAVEDTTVDPVITHWYKITDPSKLGTADYMDGVLPFDPAATEADEASFKYVTDHPTTLEGYHLHDEIYTKEEFDALLKEYERLLMGLRTTMNTLLKWNPLPIPKDVNGNPRTKIGIQVGGTLEKVPHDLVLHALGTETDEELDLTQYRNICSAYDVNKNHSWGVLWDYVPNEKLYEYGDTPQVINSVNFGIKATIQTNISWSPNILIGTYKNNGGTNHDGTIIPGPHDDVGIYTWNSREVWDDPISPNLLINAAQMCGYYDENYEYIDCAVIDKTYNGTIGQNYRSYAIIVKGDNGYRLLHITSSAESDSFDTQMINLGNGLTDIQSIIGTHTTSEDGNTFYQTYVIFGTFENGKAIGIYKVDIEDTETTPNVTFYSPENIFTLGTLRLHDPIVVDSGLSTAANRTYRVIMDDHEGDSVRIFDVNLTNTTGDITFTEVNIPDEIVTKYPDVQPMSSAYLNGVGVVLLGGNNHENHTAAVYSLQPNGAFQKIYEPGSELTFNFGNPVIHGIDIPRKPYINTDRTDGGFIDTIIGVSLELTPTEEDGITTEMTVYTYAVNYATNVWECFSVYPHGNDNNTAFDYLAWDKDEPNSTACVMVTDLDETSDGHSVAVLKRKTDFSKDSGLLRWVINPTDFLYAKFRLSYGRYQEILLEGKYDEDSNTWNMSVCSPKLFQLQAIINGLKEWDADDLENRRVETLHWMDILGTPGTDIGKLGNDDYPYDPDDPYKPDNPPDLPDVPDTGLADLISRHYWSKEALRVMLEQELEGVLDSNNSSN